MVNRKQFEEICNKYGLDSKKLIKNNENVLEKADYNSICYVLDFLRDTLKVTPNNIEKCPIHNKCYYNLLFPIHFHYFLLISYYLIHIYYIFLQIVLYLPYLSPSK